LSVTNYDLQVKDKTNGARKKRREGEGRKERKKKGREVGKKGGKKGRTQDGRTNYIHAISEKISFDTWKQDTVYPILNVLLKIIFTDILSTIWTDPRELYF
jgi:hypothetical protein